MFSDFEVKFWRDVWRSSHIRLVEGMTVYLLSKKLFKESVKKRVINEDTLSSNYVSVKELYNLLEHTNDIDIVPDMHDIVTRVILLQQLFPKCRLSYEYVESQLRVRVEQGVFESTASDQTHAKVKYVAISDWYETEAVAIFEALKHVLNFKGESK